MNMVRLGIGNARSTAPWLGLALLALAVLLAPVWGPAPGAEDLPTGEQVLERSLEATGGRAAHEAITSRVSTGTMEMPAMGLTATMTTQAMAPNLVHTLVESDAIGRIESGSNGVTFWEITAMTGPRLKSGEEKIAARREALFHGDLNWRELYSAVETTGIDTIDGLPCFQLAMTPTEGPAETRFYDAGTYLPVKFEMTVETEMGTIPIEVFISDWRVQDGVKQAFRTRQVLMGVQEIVMATATIEHNVALPPETFALPADVEALQAKEAEEEAIGEAGE